MTELTRPGRDEASEYYFKYIDLVPDGDICQALETQGSEMMALFQRIAQDRVDYRYAPDKWSVREVLSHLNDTERLFAFRAFWFARGLEEPLPSFDPDIAGRHAAAEERSWQSHVDEFRSLRASTVLFFRGLPEAAWRRRGTASGMPFSVRALAYLAVGHVIHHVALLRERYSV